MRRKPLFPPPVDPTTHKKKRHKGRQEYSVLTINGRVRLWRVRWHSPGDGSSAPLDAYAGIYANPGYGDATVSVVDGALHLAWSVIPAPLLHWHLDQFATKSELPWAHEKVIQFRVDAKAKPVELSLLEQVFVKRA